MKKLFVIVLLCSTIAAAQSLKEGPNAGQGSERFEIATQLENSSGSIGLSQPSIPQPSVVFKSSSRDRLPGKLTGDLAVDLFSSDTSVNIHKDRTLETRAALKAGLFSLLIPGAGQIYNGGTTNYIKGAAFLAVEAAGWIVNAVWMKKGNDQTNAFRAFADSHYSVVRYAQWIQMHYQSWEEYGIGNGNGTGGQVQDPAIVNQYVGQMVTSSSGPPWDQINWPALNLVEKALGGGFFSHWLFIRPNVEYYKEIGKYPQFIEGWEGANGFSAPPLSDTTYEQLLAFNTPQSIYFYYGQQRALATHLYTVASVALFVILANHFASAIEAALWAHSHEKRIVTSVGLSPLPDGLGYQTDLQVSLRF